MTPTVGVVVLAWQDEPYLAECVAALRGSTGVDVRLVVVDNGCRPEDLPPDVPDVTVLRPGRNTGFAGGCNLGAAALDTEYLALVNSDCVVAPDTLAKLVAEAALPWVGPVMASIRLPGGLLNSGGNPVHLIGLSWAGGLGTEERARRPTTSPGPAARACCSPPPSGSSSAASTRSTSPTWRTASCRCGRGGWGWPRAASRRPSPATTTSSPATRTRCTSWSATG